MLRTLKWPLPRAAGAGSAHRWRLFLPLAAIASLVAIAATLLIASQRFEHERQSQRLISETLWAEQALSYEFARLVDGLQLAARSVDEAPLTEAEAEFRRRGAAAMKRSPEVSRLYVWHEPTGAAWVYPAASAGPALSPESSSEVRQTALRALRLNAPAVGYVHDSSQTLTLAVPSSAKAGDPVVVVAAVSLGKLLESTIPWWFAHEARISLEDSSGRSIAVRDPNVLGSGIYRHRITTQLADQVFYLTANSSRGTPFVIPNLLAFSVLCLSLLLAWTVYALWRDLTLRTNAEAALRKQQALQEAMENSLLTGLRARDMEGRVTYVNPALCEMLGCSRAELIGTLLPITPTEPEGGAPANAVWESVLHKRDGSRLDVLLHEAPLLDGSGRQAGWMASIMDITERKRDAEFVRQQSERMHRMSRIMTMGEMSSALAHELNQPLAAVTSYVSAALNLMESPCPEPDLGEVTTMLTKAKGQANRAGAIISRVRQFIRKAGPGLVRVDLNELVTDLLPLVRLQAGNLGNEEVIARLGPSLPAVTADKILLEQVILNLTRNGFDAMRETGATRRRVVIFAELDRANPSLVVIGVRDHGPGLVAGCADAIGTSFSTSKPDGMGMGLAICRTALEVMGTRLAYVDADGGGAEFRFSLPVAGLRTQ